MPRPVSPGRRASRRAGTLGLCHRLDLRPLCLAGNGDGRPVGRDRRSSGDSVRVHPAETMAGRRMRSEAVGNLSMELECFSALEHVATGQQSAWVTRWSVLLTHDEHALSCGRLGGSAVVQVLRPSAARRPPAARHSRPSTMASVQTAGSGYFLPGPPSPTRCDAAKGRPVRCERACVRLPRRQVG